MSSQYKVCPLFWADRGSDRRLVNMEALEELLNEGWLEDSAGGYHATNGIA